jgi:hypothetical protein
MIASSYSQAIEKPLNPLLYSRLKRVFGHVKISNQGVGMVSRYGPNAVTGKTQIQIDYGGETYCVCCPKCHDTRFRLRINYKWGARDRVTGSKNLFLVYCQNENCYRTLTAREQLYQMVSEGASLCNAHVAAGDTSPEARRIVLPGVTVTLDKLPIDHPACTYMAGRFYDPEKLGRVCKVGYCAESHYYLAANRIIIPVYQSGELKGWQARYIGELDWKNDKDLPPKYWSCPGMQRGKVLYNFDNARQYSTCVMVEGPMDVFSFGPMAVASFGFPPTIHQLRLVVPAFDQIILLFDKDILDKESTRRQFNEIVAELRGQKPGGVAAVQLPDGDPGNYDREFLREFAAQEAAKQGVTVAWSQKNSKLG